MKFKHRIFFLLSNQATYFSIVVDRVYKIIDNNFRVLYSSSVLGFDSRLETTMKDDNQACFYVIIIAQGVAHVYRYVEFWSHGRKKPNTAFH